MTNPLVIGRNPKNFLVMKIIALLFTGILTACSTVPTEPVKLQEGSKIGVINLVGQEAKNNYWGLTIFENFNEIKTVDWGVREYIDKGIKRRIENGSNYKVVIINDAPIREALQSSLLNSFNQVTQNAKTSLSEVKKKHDIDVVILVYEAHGYVGGYLYTDGYGIHGLRNDGFIHANFSIYSIELEDYNLFFPTVMDQLSKVTEPLHGIKPVPILRYIDKEEKSFNLSERVQRIIQDLIDVALDRYFSLLPIDPPLSGEFHDQ